MHAIAGDAITAADLLWDGAERFAERPCVTDLDGDGVSLTYAEVAARAAATAGALRELGLRPGDRVALLLNNGQAYVDAFLGAIAAGLLAVPLNVRLTREDYRHMLTDSDSRVLVTDPEFLDRVPDVDGTRVVLAHSLAERAAAATPVDGPHRSRDSDVASLMYTSGTTGAPKAVMLTHESWRSVAATAVDVLGMADGEVTLHVAPLTHGAGFLLPPTLAVGGQNLLCASYDAARTARLLHSHGVTGGFVVPSMIRMLLDALPPGYAVPETFRRLYYAGSPIDPETLREATAVFGGRLVQSFAQMESPMFFTVLDQRDHARALADPGAAPARSAGRVLPGVELWIVDEHGTPVPRGETGEIVARAPQTMAGYWNRPEATAAALRDGRLHTGDVGYLDADGYLYLVDRTKDMIVTGGSNVYAREVEEVLLRLPGVREAAVVGLPHRIWGEAVTAVLVPTAGPRPEAEIVAECRVSLAGYRVPKRVIWVDELPRNAYGKVLKRRLRDELTETSDRLITKERMPVTQYPLPPALLDKAVYTDPERYRREITEVFHHAWFPVHPSSDVAAPRDYVVWDQIGQSVVITRLDDGTVSAWHNVCQHRGARLVDGTGNCGAARFTCPWHGFAYGLDGAVNGVPLRESFAESELTGLRAPSVRATEWGGWIWLCLSDDVPPLAEYLGDVGTELAGYGIDRFTTKFRTSVRLRANWKIVVDAFNETWHVPFTHRDTLVGMVMWRDATLKLAPPHSWMTLPIRGFTERAAALDDHRASHLCHYLAFPNTIFSCFPTHLQMWSAWPVSPDETVLCAYEVVGPPPDGVPAEKWERRNQRDWDQFLEVLGEDSRVIDSFATVVGSLGFTRNMFNTAESRLTAFHHELAKRLGDGAPR